MSSFGEEKGLNQIKTNPKDFVRYNLRQNSRVYPAGARINSSNYMPQVSTMHLHVACVKIIMQVETDSWTGPVNVLYKIVHAEVMPEWHGDTHVCKITIFSVKKYQVEKDLAAILFLSIDDCMAYV